MTLALVFAVFVVGYLAGRWRPLNRLGYWADERAYRTMLRDIAREERKP